MLHVLHQALPVGAEAVSVEFDLYALGNWTTVCIFDACAGNDLKIIVGGNHIVDLDLFEKGLSANHEGTAHEIKWIRSVVDAQTLHIELIVPSKYFASKDLDVEVDLNVPAGIGVGVDFFRVTTGATNCPGVMSGIILRRSLQEYMKSSKFLPRKYLDRKLFVDIETDECECVCPALPPGPGTGSAAPKVMNLYWGQDEITCAPKGEPVGTVTMTQRLDGQIAFAYKVDPQYDLKETNVYVGEFRLPSNANTGEFLPPDQFPFTGVTGVSDTVLVEPDICDYYVAAHAYVSKDARTQRSQIVGAISLRRPPIPPIGMRRFPISGSHACSNWRKNVW